ncbi:MAG: IS110 family transposase [Acidimicrobiales bacterium]
MLYAGLDLSRRRLDVHVLDEDGHTVEVTAVRPDADALRTLAAHVFRHGHEVTAVIESMTGARFVHDQLELRGWDVAIGDAVKVKGLAPLAAKTDKIDAWVLAELGRRDLVPEIWLPDPSVRAERERARFRLHLVRHRTALKNRIHATLITFGHPVPVSDLFGVAGRELLARMDVPEPWRSSLATSLAMVDDLDERIGACAKDLRVLGADHPYIPLLLTIPGVGHVLAYTIASEIGDIRRFASPKKLTGYTGLCPRVYQSGDRDVRGPLTKNGPKYLRWALVEAATHAARDARYRERYERNKKRLGRQRGAKVARVDIARKLAEAIWHILTKNEPFAPAGPTMPLVA